MARTVREYIRENWDACIKFHPESEGTLIGLPHPYTVPAVGFFNEMYYWDTYFTNKGLQIEGRYEQARYNTENMLYLVDRYGFMPNGNRTFYLNRSQPPFLSLMVRDVYEHDQDLMWLSAAYDTLKTEYRFWTTQRTSDVGLAHYDCRVSPDEQLEVANAFVERIGMDMEEPEEQLAHHFYTTAESGWDINPRWEVEGYHYASVELNSLLYMFEKNMSDFAKALQNGEEEAWQERAAYRRQQMIQLMEDECGLLLDYNFVDHKRSKVLSAASFYPLFAGLATQRHADAIVAQLDRLEAEYGILTCEKNDIPGNYQWNYPNGWACLQYIAIMGLERYGYQKEAERIARKYLRLVERVFEENGNIWEKYNIVEGSINVSNEYEMPPMMGWSAGVYLAALSYLNKLS